MNMVKSEYHGTVALMNLTRGTTNALNTPFIIELSETLDMIAKDPNVNGIVISSSNEKFFCIGYDLKELHSLSRQEFTEFYHVFNQFCVDLITVPKPTIAAITGHAIAGGCALTLCCDYRFIAEGHKLMGFNVLRLGIPVPYLVGWLLHHIVGARAARNIADSGQFFTPQQLLDTGLVDSVLPLETVISKSLEKVQTLGDLPHRAFTITKCNRNEAFKKEILTQLEEKNQEFIDCWFSEETQTLLKNAAEKF
ncbi:MAG: enoyl-CoA hydratase/isomerase family protein [Theionarchaea archaeon]|nr:enoyl-CoA hydratase/isomerase family protein [Theionarchaea archaeon]MBU6999932.1 enoyl-CoA hydratase/isomerase family protein [Theionarchaea archaeon]MBU7020122.1 enoyl-CoA hydratase/isomerase family protein [Theionarchaea archaeon]MBU7035831.1 enoyl-CoA hydratase/isomerase family protein [Theionarchaea archaeon]MBU7041416.1 enoyl-CoA hydratase/isomerase family protein [Theionarchaea archaeon]